MSAEPQAAGREGLGLNCGFWVQKYLSILIYGRNVGYKKSSEFENAYPDAVKFTLLTHTDTPFADAKEKSQCVCEMEQLVLTLQIRNTYQ